MDANWSPRSEVEARHKPSELKSDAKFKQKLVDVVISVYKEPQRGLQDYQH
jgi:hypothetical protein